MWKSLARSSTSQSVSSSLPVIITTSLTANLVALMWIYVYGLHEWGYARTRLLWSWAVTSGAQLYNGRVCLEGRHPWQNE